MNPRMLPLVLLALAACVPEPTEWEDLDLGAVPFSNTWVDRGTAVRRVLDAEGFVCPDGSTARVHVLEPAQEPSVPRPLALVFHDRVFDYLDAGQNHFEDEDRLDAGWADGAVERLLGLSDEGAVGAEPLGVWPAMLLEAGWSVALPANCWGDYWHGRGRNDLDGEGFLREGARLASEAIALAAARPGITDQRVLAVGLGDGGRAITEMALDGVPLDAVIFDSTPDWLSPVLAQPNLNQRRIAGMERIWADDIDPLAASTDRLEQLRVALQRDSMVHLVADLGFRTPVVWAWSPEDERVDADMMRPASETIGAVYPVDRRQVVDWLDPAHAPSNSERSLEATRGLVAWVDEVLGPFVYETPPEPAP